MSIIGNSTYPRETAWRPFPPSNHNREAPMPIVAKLDDLGTGAWIALTIIGFFI